MVQVVGRRGSGPGYVCCYASITVLVLCVRQNSIMLWLCRVSGLVELGKVSLSCMVFGLVFLINRAILFFLNESRQFPAL